MCFIVKIVHHSKKNNKIARVYLLSQKFRLFSVRIESSESAIDVPCPTSVTIASGKRSAMICILAQLIDGGYFMSIDGKKISRDKAIAEIMSQAFGVKVDYTRQLLKKYKDTHNYENLITGLANEPILECGV